MKYFNCTEIFVSLNRHRSSLIHEIDFLVYCLGNWAVFYMVVSTQGNLCFLILIEGTFSPAGLRFGGILKAKAMNNNELLRLLVDWIQNNNRAIESLQRFCEDCDIDFEKAMETINGIYSNGVENA